MFYYLLMDDLKNVWNVVSIPCYSMCFCWPTNYFIKRKEELVLLLWLKRIQSWKFGLLNNWTISFPCWSISGVQVMVNKFELGNNFRVIWYVGVCSLLTYSYRFPLAKGWWLKTIEYAHFYTIYIIPLWSKTISFLVDQSYMWSCCDQ